MGHLSDSVKTVSLTVGDSPVYRTLAPAPPADYSDRTVTDTVIAVAWFVLALAGAWIGVVWQDARERRRPYAHACSGLILDAMSWVPVIVFVAAANWQIIVADLAGGWVGGFLAVRRTRVLATE